MLLVQASLQRDCGSRKPADSIVLIAIKAAMSQEDAPRERRLCNRMSLQRHLCTSCQQLRCSPEVAECNTMAERNLLALTLVPF
jgi:hypothetical protein